MSPRLAATFALERAHAPFPGRGPALPEPGLREAFPGRRLRRPDLHCRPPAAQRPRAPVGPGPRARPRGGAHAARRGLCAPARPAGRGPAGERRGAGERGSRATIFPPPCKRSCPGHPRSPRSRRTTARGSASGLELFLSPGSRVRPRRCSSGWASYSFAAAERDGVRRALPRALQPPSCRDGGGPASLLPAARPRPSPPRPPPARPSPRARGVRVASLADVVDADGDGDFGELIPARHESRLRLFARGARTRFPGRAYCLPTAHRGINHHDQRPRFCPDRPGLDRVRRLRSRAITHAVAEPVSHAARHAPAERGGRGRRGDAADPPRGGHDVQARGAGAAHPGERVGGSARGVRVAGRLFPGRRPAQCERGERRHRLRRLRLLHHPRLRFAEQRAGPHRRRLRAREHLLPAVQRAAGRGREGAGGLPLRREPALRRRAPGPQAADGGPLGHGKRVLRQLRDLRGRRRRQPGVGGRLARRALQRRVPRFGRVPRRPRLAALRLQPRAGLAPRRRDTSGGEPRVRPQPHESRRRACPSWATRWPTFPAPARTRRRWIAPSRTSTARGWTSSMRPAGTGGCGARSTTPTSTGSPTARCWWASSRPRWATW